MKKPKQTIWIGVIPDIFGYGISVAGNSKAECLDALKKSYKKWKEGYPNEDTNFKKSYEDFGGRVDEIELGKAYFDNFGE